MQQVQDYSHPVTSLNSLLDLLEEERLTLCSAYPDGQTLSRIALEKQGHFDHLESILDELNPLVDASAQPEPANSNSNPERNQFLDTLRQVQKANNLNGELLHSRMVWNQQILNLMKESRSDFMYHANGKAPSQLSRHSTVA